MIRLVDSPRSAARRSSACCVLRDRRRLLHADGGARVPVGQRVPDDPQGGVADHEEQARQPRPTSAPRSTRRREVEYSIKTISGKDLDIQQLGDTALRTSFAYNVEIPIVEPVYLLVKYEGTRHLPAASRDPETRMAGKRVVCARPRGGAGRATARLPVRRARAVRARADASQLRRRPQRAPRVPGRRGAEPGRLAAAVRPLLRLRRGRSHARARPPRARGQPAPRRARARPARRAEAVRRRGPRRRRRAAVDPGRRGRGADRRREHRRRLRGGAGAGHAAVRRDHHVDHHRQLAQGRQDRTAGMAAGAARAGAGLPHRPPRMGRRMRRPSRSSATCPSLQWRATGVGPLAPRRPSRPPHSNCSIESRPANSTCRPAKEIPVPDNQTSPRLVRRASARTTCRGRRRRRRTCRKTSPTTATTT